LLFDWYSYVSSSRILSQERRVGCGNYSDRLTMAILNSNHVIHLILYHLQGNPNIVIALAGNKSDLSSKRKVRPTHSSNQAFEIWNLGVAGLILFV
jgi:broad-specificity NMP kinase